MGVIAQILDMLFGSGAREMRQTLEVFRENAEGAAVRGSALRHAALDQFAAEFAHPQPSRFDRLMDALNRLPRPGLALGTLGLFIAAMVDPIWFAARMQGLTLVPEPLWWLLGVIVSFYFGARHQAKGQAFQREMGAVMMRLPVVLEHLEQIDQFTPEDAEKAEENPALTAWRTQASSQRNPATM